MANTATTMHRDPVCGMAVDEGKAAGSSEYQGEKLLLRPILPGEVQDRSGPLSAALGIRHSEAPGRKSETS